MERDEEREKEQENGERNISIQIVRKRKIERKREECQRALATTEIITRNY